MRETDQRHLAFVEAALGQQLGQILVEDTGGFLDAVQHLGGVAALEAEPLPAERHRLAREWRVRRDKFGIGQQRLPFRREADEVVAVGAIAVEQDDELLGLAVLREKTRSVEDRHGDEG